MVRYSHRRISRRANYSFRASKEIVISKELITVCFLFSHLNIKCFLNSTRAAHFSLESHWKNSKLYILKDSLFVSFVPEKQKKKFLLFNTMPKKSNRIFKMCRHISIISLVFEVWGSFFLPIYFTVTRKRDSSATFIVHSADTIVPVTCLNKSQCWVLWLTNHSTQHSYCSHRNRHRYTFYLYSPNSHLILREDAHLQQVYTWKYPYNS